MATTRLQEEARLEQGSAERNADDGFRHSWRKMEEQTELDGVMWSVDYDTLEVTRHKSNSSLIQPRSQTPAKLHVVYAADKLRILHTRDFCVQKLITICSNNELPLHCGSTVPVLLQQLTGNR